MTSAFGAGGQPPPRRDNGLRADQFVALADVDPRLGEHLLDLLRLAEIAAYLEPSTDPRVAVRYRVSGPVERLYVHADQRQEARAVVVAAAHEAGGPAAEGSAADGSAGGGSAGGGSAGGGSAGGADGSAVPRAQQSAPDVLDGVDTDAEFARIVAGFAGAATEPDADQGDAAQGDAAQGDAAQGDAAQGDAAQGDAAQNQADARGRSGPVNRRGIDPGDLVVDPDDADDPHDHDDSGEPGPPRTRPVVAAGAVDDDDHFHPPPAPPFPVPTANTVGAVLLVVLGMLVLLRGDLFGLDSNTSFPASIILLLTASALFIRGLRDRPEPGDEPDDDGAEV